jgi:hypothetical protein
MDKTQAHIRESGNKSQHSKRIERPTEFCATVDAPQHRYAHRIFIEFCVFTCDIDIDERTTQLTKDAHRLIAQMAGARTIKREYRRSPQRVTRAD